MNNQKLKTLYAFYIINLLVMPLGLFLRILYSKSLTLEEFGVIFTALNFFGLLYLLLNSGFLNSINYYISKNLVKNNYSNIRSLILFNFLIQMTIVLITSLFLYMLSEYIIEIYFQTQIIRDSFIIFILYFIVVALSKLVSEIFLAFDMGLAFVSLNFSQFLLTLIFCYSLFIFTSNANLLYKFSLIWVIVTFITTIIGTIFLIFKKKQILIGKYKFKRDLSLKFLKYSKESHLSTTSNLLLSQIDIVFITFILTVSSVGLYTSAVSIINMSLGLFASLSFLILPLFSKLKENKQKNTIRNLIFFIYSFLLFLVIPISVLLFSFSENFLRILFGEEFVASSTVLSIFAIFIIFKILITFDFAFINGLNLNKNLNKYLIKILTLTLVSSYFLTVNFGLIGISFATVLGWVLIKFATHKILYKEIGFNFEIKNLGKIIINGFIFYLVLNLILKNISLFQNIYINFIITIITSILVYFICGYIFKIYKLENIYYFIPNSKLKVKIKNFHKKHFNFLK